MVIEISNQTKARVNFNIIKKAIRIVLQWKKKKGAVSVVVVNDKVMAKINKRFRKQNKPTDILSFTEEGSLLADKNFIGELIIDLAQIKRQARVMKNSINKELAFITIHGMLHLLGYEDETAKGAKKMDELGEKLLKELL